MHHYKTSESAIQQTMSHTVLKSTQQKGSTDSFFNEVTGTLEVYWEQMKSTVKGWNSTDESRGPERQKRSDSRSKFLETNVIFGTKHRPYTNANSSPEASDDNSLYSTQARQARFVSGKRSTSSGGNHSQAKRTPHECTVAHTGANVSMEPRDNRSAHGRVGRSDSMPECEHKYHRDPAKNPTNQTTPFVEMGLGQKETRFHISRLELQSNSLANQPNASRESTY